MIPGVTPLATFAEDIAALLDHLGVDRFILAGLSMGGRVRDGVLPAVPGADPAGAGRHVPVGRDTGRQEARAAMADRLLREGMTGYADEVLHKMVLAPYADAEVAAHVHRTTTATPPEGAAAALRGRAQRPDYRDLLTRVTVPALVVVGADDEYTPVPDAEAMHAALPHSTLSVIAAAAHLPNLERPGGSPTRRWRTSWTDSTPEQTPHPSGEGGFGHPTRTSGRQARTWTLR